jgi:integrase
MTQAKVIDLGARLKLPTRRPPKPRSFGTIKRRGQQWYVKFPYLGTIVETGTGCRPTKKHEIQLRALLDRVGDAVESGKKVRLAEVFPNATQKQKERWAALEGRTHKPEPGELTFGEYLDTWVRTILDRDPSENKRRDYRCVIEGHLRPRFSGLTFEEITGPGVVQFVMDLVRLGRSKDRIQNVLIPLRVIYRDACAEHLWLLPDPFTFAAHRLRNGRILPPKRREPPEPFRFGEWERIVAAIDEWNRPIVEVMVMTGMSASELAGLRRCDVLPGRIRVRNKISKGVEESCLKTAYRTRDLPVTAGLQRRLDNLAARVRGEYLVTRPDGETFTARVFWSAWKKALKAAGVLYRKPYTTRHTFAVWALLLGVQPVRLVKLMGHGSKAMVFDVYGDYVEGLEKDTGAIRDYLGADFS